ncbi:MAG: hypothetical protein IJW45_05055 [Oscillospiraceae bacterium]|nr:hypothetical protein [Oscillospiraceae bacterium]
MGKHIFWNTLRVELRKASRSKLLWTALLLGCAFLALDLYESYINIQQAIDNTQRSEELGLGKGYLGYSLFSSWCGIAGGTYGSALFLTVWPVLAAMAYGWSYNDERIAGVYDQIAVRVGPRRYFLAKHTAVFVSGGIAVMVPMLLDLLVMALFYPATDPVYLRDCNFLCALNYASPWAFSLARCLIYFLFGGAAACVCHVAGTYLRHGVMVILTPYAILMAIESLTTMLRESIDPVEILYTLSPFQMVRTAGFADPGWLLLGTLVIMTVGSYALGYWQVKRNELV